MPKLILKIEGKRNGIKTNIVNMREVSQKLKVPTEYPLKFMGIEFGSQIIYKEKGNDITTIINGAFKDEQLQKCLDKFIEKYLLCPKCTYPELVLRVRNGLVSGKCDSCGERAKCDNVHNIAAYIVKNPPTYQGIKREKEPENQNINIGKFNTSPENAIKPPTKSLKEDNDESINIKKLQAEDITLNSSEIQCIINTLSESIKNQRQEDGSFADIDISLSNIIQDIKGLNIQKGLDSQITYILFQSLFTINIAHEVKNNAEILAKTLIKLKLSKPEVQLMMNLCYLLFRTYENQQDFSAFTPTILKYFLDHNLLSENFLIQFASDKIVINDHFLYDPVLFNKFREAAAPFLEWIQNAEDEEDEDNEEN